MSKKLRLRIPIVVKMVGVTVTLMLIASSWITYQSSDYFTKQSRTRESDVNQEAAKDRATEVDELLTSYIEKIRIVASLLLKDYPQAKDKEESLDLSFRQDRDLVNVEVYEIKDNQIRLIQQTVNEDLLKQSDLKPEYLSTLRVRKPFPTAAVFAGAIEVRNSSLPDGAAMLTIGIPFVKDDEGRITHVALADVRLERLQKSFSTVSYRTLFLVDREGTVIAHPNDKLALETANLKGEFIVAKGLNATGNQEGADFTDPKTGKSYIGNISKTSYGPVVIAQASEESILELSNDVRIESFYVTGLVLSGAIFFIFLFSMTLTQPIERLAEVTNEVAAGNFNVHLNITTQDEVGDLARSFDHMVDGLRERDKMKNVLNKFHGSSITEDLLKGDLQLGGVNKTVTVFFSDIRDFTAFSEGHSPEEVVGMLNEYFEIMVAIVTKHHGVVDKFVGDAMMAIWGAPNSSGDDEANAVRASLEMRLALADLNTKRLERGQTAIKIGMGLHSGPAISGTIGSSQRMEYTVIGDTVNMASRIESSTKAFGTDMLVSENIAHHIGERFMLELAGHAEVKGKTEPLAMYKVRGYIDEHGHRVDLTTAYSDYEAGHVDKVKVA